MSLGSRCCMVKLALPEKHLAWLIFKENYKDEYECKRTNLF